MKDNLVIIVCVLTYLLVVLVYFRFLGVSRDNRHRRQPPPKDYSKPEDPAKK